MTLRPRANEIPLLIRQLADANPNRVDAAKARLAVIGARAVEALIESLDADDVRIRRHAIRLLALIRDARAREPLKAMLFDGEPETCADAARALARFPGRDTAAALERLLRRTSDVNVRIASVEAMLELHGTEGDDSALATLLEVLLDPSERPDVRRAAVSLLPRLPTDQRRGLKRRLERDHVLAEAARDTTVARTASRKRSLDMDDLLNRLGSDEYAEWDSAVQHLGEAGEAAVEPLVDRMLRLANDPEFCARAGMVLKAMGPRRGRRLVDLLDRVDEPVPLSVIVEVIGSFGVHAMTYRLADVIDSVAQRRRDDGSSQSTELLERVRAKAHLELARIGSRVAIQDLRDALTARGRRLELEMLAAVERVGKKDELADLLRAWDKEDPFMRERIADVIRAVVRRERIRRNSVFLRTLSERGRQSLLTILDRPKRPSRPSGGARPR